MSYNGKGIKRYESVLKTICNTEDFDNLSPVEWEGCLGVACVMAVKEGTDPSMRAVCNFFDISDGHIEKAFTRLKLNGIFKQSLRDDKVLSGFARDTEWRTGNERSLNAWCTIAGIASGLIGTVI